MSSVELGKRLKALRKSLKFNQDDVADRSGTLKRNEISRMENGHHQGTTARVQDGLAKAFGADRDELFRYLTGEIELTALTVQPPKAPRAEADHRYGTKNVLDAIDALIKDGYSWKVVRPVVETIGYKEGKAPITSLHLYQTARRMLEDKGEPPDENEDESPFVDGFDQDAP